MHAVSTHANDDMLTNRVKFNISTI